MKQYYKQDPRLTEQEYSLLLVQNEEVDYREFTDRNDGVIGLNYKRR